MRLSDIFTTAGHNLGRNKMRTALTVLAIFIGTLTLTLTNGIGAGINQYIDDQLGSFGAENVMVIQAAGDTNPFITDDTPKTYDASKKLSAGRGGFAIPILTDTDINRVKAVSGIIEVEPYTPPVPDYISGPNNTKYQISVSEFVDGTTLDLVVGKSPSNSASNYQIALPVNYPTHLGFPTPESAIGQTVHLGISNALGDKEEIAATVVGVQQKSLLAIGGASINKSLVNGLYDWQSQGLPASIKQQYQAALARFDKAFTKKQITDLKATLKTLGYTAQTAEDRIGIIHQVIGGITVVFNIFGIIALIAAAFGIINTLLMAVAERTKEIGLMKSMGMSSGRIFTLFSIEAALLGFWGSALGTIAAIGLALIANNIASNSFLKDFPGLHLLAFPPATTAGIMLLIILIAFLSGVLPAIRAAQKNPIDALRYE